MFQFVHHTLLKVRLDNGQMLLNTELYVMLNILCTLYISSSDFFTTPLVLFKGLGIENFGEHFFCNDFKIKLIKQH